VTAHKPVEQRVGSPVASVSQIKPCHPSLDMPLVVGKWPRRIIDDVEIEVGTIDDFSRCEFDQEVVRITGSDIGIDGAALVDWHAEMSGCRSAPHDTPRVLMQPAEQAGVDVELEMPGSRPESSTGPIEIRWAANGSQHLPVIEELPRRRLGHGPARLAPHVAVNGPHGGRRDEPLVPDALSRELSSAHHCLSPTSGDAETLRRVSERKQVPRHWYLLYQAWINKYPTQSL